MIESRRRVVGGDACDGLDDGLDLLAHVGIGDAEHSRIGDLRVAEQLAFESVW